MLLGHGSTLCLRTGGGGSRTCVFVFVCGSSPDEAALARGSPSARGSSKPVPSSPAPPRPFVPLTDLLEPLVLTHAHIHRRAYFNNCLHSSCHTWPSIPPPSFFRPIPLLFFFLQTYAQSFLVEAIWPTEACGSTGTSAYMLLVSS